MFFERNIRKKKKKMKKTNIFLIEEHPWFGNKVFMIRPHSLRSNGVITTVEQPIF